MSLCLEFCVWLPVLSTTSKLCSLPSRFTLPLGMNSSILIRWPRGSVFGSGTRSALCFNPMLMSWLSRSLALSISNLSVLSFMLLPQRFAVTICLSASWLRESYYNAKPCLFFGLTPAKNFLSWRGLRDDWYMPCRVLALNRGTCIPNEIIN